MHGLPTLTLRMEGKEENEENEENGREQEEEERDMNGAEGDDDRLCRGGGRRAK